jgi:hypothetical protein
MNGQHSATSAAPARRYGKYRGTVIENIDPLQLGRVQVLVPRVSEKDAIWAMPCVPAAGLHAGVFIVPPIGSAVWVEFEEGDLDYPIWTGGFWIEGELPPIASPGQNIVLQTTGGNIMMVSDAPPSPANGGIVLKSAGGAMIVVNDSGIYISNGKGAAITLVGPVVDINNSGLTVT